MEYAWYIQSSNRKELTHTVQCAEQESLCTLATDANKIVALATHMGSTTFHLSVDDNDVVSISMCFGSEVTWEHFACEFMNL